MFNYKQTVGAGLICVLITTASAKLPDEHSIAGLDIRSVRQGYNEVVDNDYNSEIVFHPYLLESINAITSIYAKDLSLAKYNKNGSDTTADYYIRALKQKGITVYKLQGIKGKVLRAFISANIPILLIGRHRDPDRKVTRIHGDVLYGYRPPDITQSSRTLPEEIVYMFFTARGFCLEGKEAYEMEKKEMIRLSASKTPHKDAEQILWDIYELRRDNMRVKDALNSPQKADPFHQFEYICVIATPKLTLKKIKEGVNQSLSGVGFEYKLPKFIKMDPRVLVW